MPMPPILRSLLAAAAVAALLVACRPIPQEPEAPARSDLSRPALAVRALAGHMRSGDFAAFARDAVPPALHAELEAAWRDGRTRWPLDELPLSEQIPAALGALAAPDAEGRGEVLAGQPFPGVQQVLQPDRVERDIVKAVDDIRLVVPPGR